MRKAENEKGRGKTWELLGAIPLGAGPLAPNSSQVFPRVRNELRARARGSIKLTVKRPRGRPKAKKRSAARATGTYPPEDRAFDIYRLRGDFDS